jgi:hypothetical protein
MNMVKLQKRPVLSDYKLRPVEAPESTSLTLDPRASPDQPTARNQFPLSALLDASPMPPPSTRAPSTRATNGRRTSIATNLASLLDDSEAGDDPSEMDWTPTQNTHTSFAPRAAPSIFSDTSSAPPTPSPMFTWDRPGGPRKPAAPSTPARALAAARGIPEERPKVQESPREMRFGAPKLDVRGQETGLESMFNSVFSLSDEPAGMGPRRDGGASAGLGIDGESRDVVMSEPGAPVAGGRWIGAGAWTLAVAAVFGLLVAWFMAEETAGWKADLLGAWEKLRPTHST